MSSGPISPGQMKTGPLSSTRLGLGALLILALLINAPILIIWFCE